MDAYVNTCFEQENLCDTTKKHIILDVKIKNKPGTTSKQFLLYKQVFEA